MKFNITIAVAIMMALSVCVFGQTKTITNSDLAKYREKRLDAEKQLRENYAKMGFVSPEDQAKQNAADDKARFELFQRLQADRLERERIEAERQRAIAAQQSVVIQPQIIIERQDAGGYLYGYSVLGNRHYPWRSPFRYPYRGNIGWRAAGGMIIYEGGGNSNTNISSPQIRRPVFGPPPGQGTRITKN